MNYSPGMRQKSDSEITTFGRHLTQLRQSRRLRQENLAQALGVTRDKIAYYENRAQNPTLDFVLKAARYFSVTVDELLRDDDARRSRLGPVSRLERQLEMIRRLPPKEQEAVSTVLDMALKADASPA